MPTLTASAPASISGAGALGRRDIAGDDLGVVRQPADLADRLDARATEWPCAVSTTMTSTPAANSASARSSRPRAGAGGGGDAQPAVLVLAGIRIELRLLDVLDRDQADAAIGLVDDQQLLDAVLVQEALGLLAGDALAHGDQLVPGHQLGDRLARVAGKAHVAVGQDADQLARAALDHRDAGDLVIGHQPQRVGQRLVGVDRDRVDHHPGLEFLDLADFVRLLVDRHVAVDDADPAGLRHRDRERAFGHRVHRRRDQRDAELDLAGDAGAGVGLAGQDAGCRRDQHHVVKGQRLPDFHRACYTISACVRNYVRREPAVSRSRHQARAGEYAGSAAETPVVGPQRIAAMMLRASEVQRIGRAQAEAGPQLRCLEVNDDAGVEVNQSHDARSSSISASISWRRAAAPAACGCAANPK